MGTRGAVGIICNGEEKIGYNHFDFIEYKWYWKKSKIFQNLTWLLQKVCYITGIEIKNQNKRRI